MDRHHVVWQGPPAHDRSTRQRPPSHGTAQARFQTSPNALAVILCDGWRRIARLYGFIARLCGFNGVRLLADAEPATSAVCRKSYAASRSFSAVSRSTEASCETP